MIRFYWCHTGITSLFTMSMSFHLALQAYCPWPNLGLVCGLNESVIKVESSSTLSLVTAQHTDEIDSALKLVVFN